MIVHVPSRMRGPQSRPAGPHRREKFGFIGKSEEAFELAGEVGAGAVLDQRRGAHDGKRGDFELLSGETIPDDVASNSWDRGTGKSVTLPQEFVGHVMVFRTFDRVSYGLIMDGLRPVHKHDKLELPE